jgi:hypothetical protein
MCTLVQLASLVTTYRCCNGVVEVLPAGYTVPQELLEWQGFIEW